jgi:autotransporter-associated beta strand protein
MCGVSTFTSNRRIGQRLLPVRIVRCVAAASASFAGSALAGPLVQVGNYVASNQVGQSGSTPTFVIYVSDPAANPVAEDIEGMNFTLQLADGIAALPSITNVDLTTSTVWTGNVDGGGVIPASGNGPQWQSFAVLTSAAGVAINPNGALANITLNTAGATAGTMAVNLVGTKDPTRNTAFLDRQGNTIPSAITNGTLTIVNNPVVYWTGASGNIWNSTANWSINTAVPNSSQDAYFGSHVPASGATVNLSIADTAHSLWFDGSYTLTGGRMTLGGGKITVFAGSTVALNTSVDGAAGLTMSGGGALTLGGGSANTYSGDTTVDGGTLTLAKSLGVAAIPSGNLNVNGGTVQIIPSSFAQSQFGPNVAVTLANTTSTAILSLGGFVNQTIGSLAGNGTVSFVSSTPELTVGSSGTNTTFSGAITGPARLIKVSNGTLTLSGTNLGLNDVDVYGGALNFSNFAPHLSGTTLSGGWGIFGGTLNFPAGSSVTAIPANSGVTLGAGSFPALSSLAFNQGSFDLTDQQSFTTVGDFTNDGQLDVTVDTSGTPGSHLTVNGALIDSGAPGLNSVTIIAHSTVTANYVRQHSLTIGGTGSVLSVRPQASGGGTSVLGALSLGTHTTPDGTLDIADMKLIVNSPGSSHANIAATLNSFLNSAADFNSATGQDRWDAPGITSSTLVSGGVVDAAHSHARSLPAHELRWPTGQCVQYSDRLYAGRRCQHGWEGFFCRLPEPLERLRTARNLAAGRL